MSNFFHGTTPADSRNNINVYKLAFQVSPLWLTGAPITTLGGKDPFIKYSDPALFQSALNTNFAGNPADLDDAFGAFTVLPGGSAVSQSTAKYPFANQQVAGNATIFEPLQVSLIWDTPMRNKGTNADAWSNKFNTIMTIQARLTAHNNGGGTYMVMTPALIYEDLIMTSMTDASRGTSPLPQNAWRFDFERPLIQISALQNAQSALMAKLTNGAQTDGGWTGPAAGLSLAASLPSFINPLGEPFVTPGLVTGPGGRAVGGV